MSHFKTIKDIFYGIIINKVEGRFIIQSRKYDPEGDYDLPAQVDYLDSLIGSPKIITKDFFILGVDLKSFEGCPQQIGNDISFFDNPNINSGNFCRLSCLSLLQRDG